MNGQAGKSKVGCVVYIALFSIVMALIFTIAPAYVHKIALEDEMAKALNRAGVNNWDDNTLRNEIMDLCAARGFEITRREITVNRDPRSRPVRKIRIEVIYRKAIGIGDFSHVLEFTYDGEALIGRL